MKRISFVLIMLLLSVGLVLLTYWCFLGSVMRKLAGIPSALVSIIAIALLAEHTLHLMKRRRKRGF